MRYSNVQIEHPLSSIEWRKICQPVWPRLETSLASSVAQLRQMLPDAERLRQYDAKLCALVRKQRIFVSGASSNERVNET